MAALEASLLRFQMGEQPEEGGPLVRLDESGLASEAAYLSLIRYERFEAFRWALVLADTCILVCRRGRL